MEPRTTDDEADRHSFAGWLGPVDVRIDIDVFRDHGQWYATANDFGVVGAGLTEDAAMQNLVHILAAYLQDFHKRELPLSSAIQTNEAIRSSPRPSVNNIVRLVRQQLALRLSMRHRRTLPLRSILL